MSGFCGFTGNKYNDEANTILGRMNDKIAHRGPDGEGYFVTDEISLAFRRLALSNEGQNQPASTPDGAYTIVLNGTIYNFEQLRGDAGCEAELLLNLYRQHG
ncbi:MAG: asparagine synthetase B, partial [Defluviitaleaceae bacterium]|nr:asparagine synthetase B [Defluviitaleaceae bacterium]